MIMYRRIGTTQERRVNQDNWDGQIRVRGRRRQLPSAWDDIHRNDYDDRNWKRHRRTQYKIRTGNSKKDSTVYGRSMAKRDHFHREHRACCNERRRCKWCWKNNIWDDAAIEREWRRRKQKYEDWYRKRYGSDNLIDRIIITSAHYDSCGHRT